MKGSRDRLNLQSSELFCTPDLFEEKNVGLVLQVKYIHFSFNSRKKVCVLVLQVRLTAAVLTGLLILVALVT